MSYAPRTIAFHAELVYPPMAQLRADVIQELHGKLFRQPELSYQNFQVQPNGIHLTNLATSPGAISSAVFTGDRLVFREELRGITIEDFATRVVNVSKMAFEALEIPTTVAQQFVVRSLINTVSVQDSREFLSQRVVANHEHLAAFGRPLHSLGLRLTFPQTEDNREAYQVRVEPWTQDPRSLWLENAGSFAVPTPAAELPEIGNQLFATYRFMTGPVVEFLSRFDTP